jgi:septal ring factor EnvC (AmiA/AmiB activator)
LTLTMPSFEGLVMSLEEGYRITRMEADMKELKDSNFELKTQLNNLNTSLALLTQSINSLTASEERRRESSTKIIFAIIGTVITSAVVWVIGGGLVLK